MCKKLILVLFSLFLGCSDSKASPLEEKSEYFCFSKSFDFSSIHFYNAEKTYTFRQVMFTGIVEDIIKGAAKENKEIVEVRLTTLTLGPSDQLTIMKSFSLSFRDINDKAIFSLNKVPIVADGISTITFTFNDENLAVKQLSKGPITILLQVVNNTPYLSKVTTGYCFEFVARDK